MIIDLRAQGRAIGEIVQDHDLVELAAKDMRAPGNTMEGFSGMLHYKVNKDVLLLV